MTALHISDPVETTAQRKQRLQQECLDHRAAISHSRRVIRSNLGVEAIAKTAVGIVGQRAQTALGRVTDLFDFRQLDSEKIRLAVPVLLSAYSLLSGRSLLKPVLRGAAVVGVAGASVYWYSRRKSKQKKSESQAEMSGDGLAEES